MFGQFVVLLLAAGVALGTAHAQGEHAAGPVPPAPAAPVLEATIGEAGLSFAHLAAPAAPWSAAATVAAEGEGPQDGADPEVAEMQGYGLMLAGAAAGGFIVLRRRRT